MSDFNPAAPVASSLTSNDLMNLLAMLARSKFDGLDEAEVGVALAYKMKGILQEAQQPKIELPVAPAPVGGPSQE
jgi:hypothetical protein